MTVRRSKGWLRLGFVFLAALLAVPIHAGDVKVIYATSADVLGMFTEKYRPNYPYSARAMRRTGSGLFRIYLNEKGTATAIGVMRSTGHKELDLAASGGLIQWRARPGPRREVDIPVTFTLRGR